jgi:hypothetical protein
LPIKAQLKDASSLAFPQRPEPESVNVLGQVGL